MLYLVISFVLLFFSICIGIEISKVSNYVLVTYNHWVIESSLWVALIVILLGFVLFYLLLRLIARSLRLGKQYRLWKKSYRERKAQVLTQSGLCQLAEGQWRKAEETLIKAAKLSRKPLIRYLSAATAANAQHAFERRDDYLRLAHQNEKQAAIAIGLTQAKLQFESEQWEQALSTLQHLNQLSPRHSHILKLLLQVNMQLHQWCSCYDLLPLVKKHKALNKKAYESCEYQIHFAMLNSLVESGSNELQSFWQSLPKQHRDEKFTLAYVRALIDQAEEELAAQVIVAYLKHDWSQALLPLFAAIKTDKLKQLKLAESWLAQHAQDAELLLCLGQLCIREQLWGKAKDYLLQSIQQKPSVAAYHELVTVYRLLNEPDKIEHCYRNALQLIV